MTASADVIQAAARKFLEGGGAKDIYDLASRSADNKKAIVASVGVVPKLVEMLVWDEPKGVGSWAVVVLRELVLIGQVAQDAIAQAHNGAIFKWLNGPQDHGYTDDKKKISANFTKDHAVNSLLLNAQCRGAESLANFVLWHLQIGDDATAALAMTMLIDVTTEKGVAATIPVRSIATLITVLNTNSSSTDIQASTVRDQALLLLLQLLEVEEARVALIESSLGVADHAEILKNESSGTRSKLLTVLQLRQLAQEKESTSLEIVSSDVVPVLVNYLSRPDDGELLVSELHEQIIHLLADVAQVSSLIGNAIWEANGVPPLIRLSQSTSVKAPALDTLHALLRDENHAKTLARTRGLPVLVQLYQHGKKHIAKEATSVVKILTTLLHGHDDCTNDANQRGFLDCDGSIDLLVSILKLDHGDEDVAAFAKRQGGLVPLLYDRLRDRDTKKIDTLAVVLEALEIFSRVPTNRSMLQTPKRLGQLIDLLKTTNDSNVKVCIARILANICIRNNAVDGLIVEQGAAKSLVDMVKSIDTKLQTSALMALRNLASNDVVRANIGSLSLLPRVVEILLLGKTMKQKSVAAAVLGNLAFVRANREQIVIHGGIGALVDFLREATTQQQVETAAAALWVVVDDQIVDRVVDVGIRTVLQKVCEAHPLQELTWASRLRERLQLVPS